MAMSRRGFLQGAAMAAAGCLAAGTAWAQTEATRRPNFLVIVADDMGFSDAGCYGGEIETPNLNRLASNGLRFTQHYSTARCWPSRTCILTGYYAQQVRMDPPEGLLPSWARVLPSYFKPHGYRCYHSGKWHLMGAPKPVADGGFDHSYILDDHDRHFSPKVHALDDQPLPPVERDSGYYTTTAIADYAIQFLKEHAAQSPDQPFLQYLAFTSPHFPLHALQEDIARYKERYAAGWDAIREARYRRMRDMGLVNCALSPLDGETAPDWSLPPKELVEQTHPGEVPRAVPWDSLTPEQKEFQTTKMAIHAAMIDRMDRDIGRVLDQLKAMGAYDNTVILFVSDNGASAEQIIRGDMHDPAAQPGSAASYLSLGPGWSTAANTPFRLHKSWAHEGGISSPLIVHWPEGGLEHGVLRHNPGHFVDLLPTLLQLAGAPVLAGGGEAAPPLPGRSLVPAFREDGSVPHEYLFFSHAGNRAIRVGDWKLVAAGEDGPWELYNLSTDRCEMNNLVQHEPERTKELAALWERCATQFREQAGESGV